MASFLTNLILGEQTFASNTARKQSVLLGQLTLMLAGICVIYLIADPISGLTSFLHWYFLGLCLSLLILYLNRLGRYLIAASMLMTVSIGMLFVLALLGDPDRGIYFYFVTASITSLVIFYNRKIEIGIIFVCLGVALALVAFYVDSPVRETVPSNPEAFQIRFAMNFVLGIITAVLVVLFIIKENNFSEKSLLESKESLEKLTNDLQTSKYRFERAVTATKAGIYEWNILTGEIYVSSRWKKLHGYKDSDITEISMEKFLSMIHPGDNAKTNKSMELALKQGNDYQNELRMKSKTGEYRWFLDSGIIELVEGKPAIAVGSIIDINDRKTTESELIEKNLALQKANDELDRFVYSASHDMRAPLSTLLGLIEVVKMSDDPKEYESYFEMMTKRIHDMEGFISEVTDYSRNTRLQVVTSKINVHDLILKVKESFHTLAEQASVAINLEIPSDLIIETDATRFKVILNNLIANAIKYNNSSRKEKYVLISAEQTSSDIIITIEDNGSGIGEEYQDKIFDMFYRASEDSSGSGLGLYIVKETAEKLGLRVSFTSFLNKGTTFSLVFTAVSTD